MKQFIAIVLSALLALSFAACSGLTGGTAEPATSPEATAGTEIPNPMIEADNAKAFETLGLRLDAPEGAENAKYYIISETLAEVVFTLGGKEYTYRASKDSGNISGVYDTLTDAFTMYLTYDFDNLTATASTGSEGGSLVTWTAEGVNYSLYTDSGVEEEALRSVVKAVMATSLDNVADAVSESDGVVSFKPGDTLSVDLDGDGAMETITTDIVKDEYDTEMLKVIVTPASGDAKELQTDITGFGTGFVCDVDRDGIKEVFVSGDMCSNDYEIWLFRYNGNEIVSAEGYYVPESGVSDYVIASAAGCVESIDPETGVVTVFDTVDIMGSWGCTTQFEVTNDPFAMKRTEGSIWTFTPYDEYWQYCQLVTVKEMTYTPDGSTEKATLGLGEKLMPIDTDGETYMHFMTESGIYGTVELARCTDDSFWGFMIDGAPETDYFEVVPYAG